MKVIQKWILADGVVEHPPGDLGIPVVDAAEDDEDRRDAHHHVEVGDHEVGVRQGHVDDHVAEEQSGEPADHEGEHEGDGEQHRYREADVGAPKRKGPVVDLDGRRHRDDQRRGGEEEPEVRVHPGDVHVVRPDDERQSADGDDGPDHQPVAEDVLAGVHRDEVGDDAERGQRDDVDLRMAEEPEQVLEQQRDCRPGSPRPRRRPS